jgi:molybdopterin-guanine dinucleotide biosynthesis protein A
MDRFAAVVLAGGAGRRLGGPGKPTLPVAGVPMLLRVLDAVSAAETRIVVGPADLAAHLPAGVRLTRETPPGTGPVAAAAAGLELLAAGTDRVALLAADLPLLTPAAIATLLGTLSTMDGAVFVDGAGRRQLLCGAWHVTALRGRLATLGDPAGAAIRSLVEGLRVAEVTWSGSGPPPWYDCDAPGELRYAEEQLRERA